MADMAKQIYIARGWLGCEEVMRHKLDLGCKARRKAQRPLLYRVLEILHFESKIRISIRYGTAYKTGRAPNLLKSIPVCQKCCKK